MSEGVPAEISEDKRHEMMVEYARIPIKSHIARMFGVCGPTVAKYHVLDDWEKYRDELRVARRKRSLVASDEVDANVKDMICARLATVREQLADTVPGNASIAAEMDKLARLWKLYAGEADSRAEFTPQDFLTWFDSQPPEKQAEFAQAIDNARASQDGKPGDAATTPSG